MWSKALLDVLLFENNPLPCAEAGLARPQRGLFSHNSTILTNIIPVFSHTLHKVCDSVDSLGLG